jgi:RNA recognition motif-containing protein
MSVTVKSFVNWPEGSGPSRICCHRWWVCILSFLSLNSPSDVARRRKEHTNVYVSGLPPDFKDSVLRQYGERSGNVLSVKTMIDFDTGNCTGVGFIRLSTFKEASECIRSLRRAGFVAALAKVSSPIRGCF